MTTVVNQVKSCGGLTFFILILYIVLQTQHPRCSVDEDGSLRFDLDISDTFFPFGHSKRSKKEAKVTLKEATDFLFRILTAERGLSGKKWHNYKYE